MPHFPELLKFSPCFQAWPIYMEMETFSGSLPQQQANTPENTPNLPQATSPSRQKTPTSPLQHHSIEKKEERTTKC